MTPLQLANKARLDNQLNRWKRDGYTGEIYTIQQRINRNQIVAICDRDDSYGYILEIGPNYFETDIISCAKMVFTHLKSLGIPTLDKEWN